MRHRHLLYMLERGGHCRIAVQMPTHPPSMGQEHPRDLHKRLDVLRWQLCPEHYCRLCDTVTAHESRSSVAHYNITEIAACLHLLLGIFVSNYHDDS